MRTTFPGAYQRIDVTPRGLLIIGIHPDIDEDGKVIGHYAARVEKWRWADIDTLRWARDTGDHWQLRIVAAPGAPTSDPLPWVCVESKLSHRQWRRFATRVAELTEGRLVVEPAVPAHCQPWWRRPRRVHVTWSLYRYP
ncbi:hypothetical protein [Nonomuraea fuscirosea]|uniref:hypothetical protein n=1 Tax=Nonomuraea fuscirosea TaxID=1291556 RepID=UPI0033CBB0AA